MDEYIEALKRNGYVDREALFLALVQHHSGMFLRSQYETFCGVKRGGPSQRLVDRALIRKHASAWRLTGGYRLYLWHGLPAKRRRRPSTSVAVRLLTGLDYVLAHHEKQHFLATESEKREHFRRQLVPRDAVPERLWDDPVFVERGPQTGFCFIAEGQNFKAWLKHKTALLAALGKARIVCLGRCEDEQEVSEMIREWTGGRRFSPEVEAYFVTRREWESGSRKGWSNERIGKLKHDRQRYFGADFDRAYVDFISGEGVTKVASTISVSRWENPAASAYSSLFLPAPRSTAQPPRNQAVELYPAAYPGA